MNWSFVFLAQHEDPEDGLGVAAYHALIKAKNEFKKIRNAETGKSAREKLRAVQLFRVSERHSRGPDV